MATHSRTTLVQTLETYLDRGGDVGAVAAELAIHRTTLYQRLSRIAQITAKDLHDGDDRLLLHIRLRLWRLARTPLNNLRQRRLRDVGQMPPRHEEDVARHILRGIPFRVLQGIAQDVSAELVIKTGEPFKRIVHPASFFSVSVPRPSPGDAAFT